MDGMVKARYKPGWRARAAGFTLVEVMIVVAIIGILASIAYPSYTESVAKGRRARATSQLISAEQWMERFGTENLRFDQTAGGVAVTAASQFAGRYNSVPPAGEGDAVYTLAVVATPTSFTITATRVGAMVGDRCGDLTIDQLGRKSFVAGSYSGFSDINAARVACWR